jgi:ribosomal protein S18 acetylase RimI-like enzyme
MSEEFGENIEEEPIVETRHALPRDLDGIIAAVESLRKVNAEKGRKDFVPVGEKDIKGINKEITDDQVGKMVLLVAEIDGRVQGFVEIMPNDPETATVAGITVHEDYRQRGIATSLLLEGISEIKRMFGVKKIELQTDEDNEARGLYEKCGFKEVELDEKKYKLTKNRKDKTVKRVGYEKVLE